VKRTKKECSLGKAGEGRVAPKPTRGGMGEMERRIGEKGKEAEKVRRQAEKNCAKATKHPTHVGTTTQGKRKDSAT